MTKYLKDRRFGVLGITEAKYWVNATSIDTPGVSVIGLSWGYSQSSLVKFSGITVIAISVLAC